MCYIFCINLATVNDLLQPAFIQQLWAHV